MILGFKPQFVPNIKAGTKIHTIRIDGKNRWKPGMKIQLATGVRTKHYDCFSEKICLSVQKIKIDWKTDDAKFFEIPTVLIDGENIDYTGLKDLAHNDGFDTMNDFLKWFSEDFEGKIIHWTPLIY